MKTQWYLEENPACRETRAKFFVVGVNVNPDVLTERLGVTPTKAYAKGDAYTSKAGPRVREFGQWRVESSHLIKSTSTEKHAQAILKALESKKQLIQEYIKNSTDRVGISIYWEATDTAYGGFTLKSDTLRRLTDLCSEVDFRFVSFRKQKQTSGDQ